MKAIVIPFPDILKQTLQGLTISLSFILGSWCAEIVTGVDYLNFNVAIIGIFSGMLSAGANIALDSIIMEIDRLDDVDDRKVTDRLDDVDDRKVTDRLDDDVKTMRHDLENLQWELNGLKNERRLRHG